MVFCISYLDSAAYITVAGTESRIKRHLHIHIPYHLYIVAVVNVIISSNNQLAIAVIYFATIPAHRGIQNDNIWVSSFGVTGPPALFLRHRSLLNEAFLEQDVPGIGFIRPGYFLFKKATALIGHLVPMALHPGKLLTTHVIVVKPKDHPIHCDYATKKV